MTSTVLKQGYLSAFSPVWPTAMSFRLIQKLMKVDVNIEVQIVKISLRNLFHEYLLGAATVCLSVGVGQ